MAQEISLELLTSKLKEKGITLGKLAEMTGVSKPMLSMMLNHKRNMSLVKLNSILQASEIEVVEIVKK